MTADPKRVLIVDDDRALLNLLRALLQGDFVVAEATSGEEALESLMDYRPHLVILDIMMPGIDGYETCRLIRSSPSGCDHPSGDGVRQVISPGNGPGIRGGRGRLCRQAI